MVSNITIIMYHYVRDLKKSKYTEIKGLDINLFKEQVYYLNKHYNIITIEEVIHSIESQSKLPNKSVLLTFDDAYADHFYNVFPILNELKIQGSFYVPSKVIKENIVFDVNKIHFILASIKNKFELIDQLKNFLFIYKEEYNLEDFDYYFQKLANASQFDSKEIIFIKRLLQFELDEELRSKIINKLFEKYVTINEDNFSRELYMNEDQLKYMLSKGQHIGNHGHNHYWWNKLSIEKMTLELDLSNNFLEKLGVNMNNWTACYPYGSYDNQSIKLLKDRGCKLALTNEVNIATTDKSTRFIMPRLDTNDIPKNQNEKTNKWYIKG